VDQAGPPLWAACAAGLTSSAALTGHQRAAAKRLGVPGAHLAYRDPPPAHIAAVPASPLDMQPNGCLLLTCSRMAAYEWSHWREHGHARHQAPRADRGVNPRWMTCSARLPTPAAGACWTA